MLNWHACLADRNLQCCYQRYAQWKWRLGCLNIFSTNHVIKMLLNLLVNIQRRVLIHEKINPDNWFLAEFHIWFGPGLTALEVWCLAMIGLVFLAFLAYIVILAWLRTRLVTKLYCKIFSISEHLAFMRQLMSSRIWFTKPIHQTRPASKVEPSHDMKSMYGSEKKSKKEEAAEGRGKGMEEETKMEICLFSAVVSAALIFMVVYYFIYINTQSKS